jgi:hypothetical protein
VQGLVIQTVLHVGGIHLLHQVAPVGAEGVGYSYVPAVRVPTMPQSTGDPPRIQKALSVAHSRDAAQASAFKAGAAGMEGESKS